MKIPARAAVSNQLPPACGRPDEGNQCPYRPWMKRKEFNRQDAKVAKSWIFCSGRQVRLTKNSWRLLASWRFKPPR
jgi:hypothetical protein